MAKLRTNHSRGSGGGTIVRVGLFAAILSALVLMFNRFMGNSEQPAMTEEETFETEIDVEAFKRLMPTSTTGEVVLNPYYALSYAEDYEQAEWVAYALTEERLRMPWVERTDNFMPDTKITRASASPDDYRHSGYDRGHLVPAADMAFSEEAMASTFLMSNISPQSRNFNKGIWRELEELTRDWAKKNEALYVVTGPVLTEEPKAYIGPNEVAVPTAYFKVLLDYTEPQIKGIGFILPNEVSYESLFKYAVTIDEVERQTGLDFFPNLLSNSEERAIESQVNIDLWEFNKKKYELRTRKWNED